MQCIILKEKRDKDTEGYKTQEVCVWQIVLPINFFALFCTVYGYASYACESFNVMGNMRTKAGSDLFIAKACDLIQNTLTH